MEPEIAFLILNKEEFVKGMADFVVEAWIPLVVLVVLSIALMIWGEE